MFKLVILFAVIAIGLAKPTVFSSVAYSAPVVAAPGVVTATSSQVIARNFNGIAAAPVAYTAPAAAAPLAYTVSAFSAAPLAYAAPAAYTAPVAYTAAAAPLAYSAPVLL